MYDFYYAGGPFMTPITIAGLVAIGLAVKALMETIKETSYPDRLVKSVPLAGSAAFALGLLAQAVGLYQAMGAIEAAGDISPAMLAGGFKVSLIAPIYGLILFVVSLLIWLGFNLFGRMRSNAI